MKLNGSAVEKLYFFCYMNLRYPTKEDNFIMGSLSTNLTFMVFVKNNPWSLRSTVWLGIYSKWSALMTTYICTYIIVWSFTSRFIQQIYDITKAHHFCCALMIRIYHTWFNLWKVFYFSKPYLNCMLLSTVIDLGSLKCWQSSLLIDCKIIQVTEWSVFAIQIAVWNAEINKSAGFYHQWFLQCSIVCTYLYVKKGTLWITNDAKWQWKTNMPLRYTIWCSVHFNYIRYKCKLHWICGL